MFDPKLNIIARNHRACQTFLLSLYKPNRTLFVLLFWRRIRSQVVITTQKFNILCLWKNTKTRLHKQKAETLSLRNCTRWFGFVACSLKGKHRGHFIWLQFGRCTRTVACLVCCLVSLFVGLAFSRFYEHWVGFLMKFLRELLTPLFARRQMNELTELQIWIKFIVSFNARGADW